MADEQKGQFGGQSGGEGAGGKGAGGEGREGEGAGGKGAGGEGREGEGAGGEGREGEGAGDEGGGEEVSPNDLSALWGQTSSGEQAKSSESPVSISAPEKEISPTPSSPLEKPKVSLEPPVSAVEMSQKKERPEEPEEPLEGEVVPQSKDAFDEEPIFEEEPEESRKAKLDQLLSEINLTRKHLYIFLGAGIAIIIILIFGIKFLFSFLEGRKSEAPKKEIAAEESREDREKKREREQEETIEAGEEAPPSKPASLDSSIRAAAHFGRSFILPKIFYPGTDLALSLLIGKQQVETREFGEFVILLRRLQNAYSTDIAVLLNRSVDRRAVLQNHLTLLKRLAEEANVARDQMTFQKNSLSGQLKETEIRRDDEEKNFFQAMKDLNPNAENLLQSFSEDAKKAVSLKARIQALDRLLQFYGNALAKVNARIKDIELNTEALIKGIKVFDVPGSDLDLIEPLKNSE